MIGSKTAPEPLPPVTPIDTTLSRSKGNSPINASTTLPLTQGWTDAPVPTVSETSSRGGFITSYPSPPDNTFTFDRGPKNILSLVL